MRKLFYLVLIAIFAVSATITVSSAVSRCNVSVSLNGELLNFEQQPVIIEGRTLVPLRAIFEALGASVEWDGSTRTVTSTKDGVTIQLSIGSDILYREGEKIEIDVPAQIVGEGYTMVPVRAIAEAFDVSVDWDDSTKTVILTETKASEAKNESKSNYLYNLNFNELKEAIIKFGTNTEDEYTLLVTYSNLLNDSKNSVVFVYNVDEKEINIVFNQKVNIGSCSIIVTLPENNYEMKFDYDLKVTDNRNVIYACDGYIDCNNNSSVVIDNVSVGVSDEDYASTLITQNLSNLTNGAISMYLEHNYKLSLKNLGL